MKVSHSLPTIYQIPHTPTNGIIQYRNNKEIEDKVDRKDKEDTEDTEDKDGTEGTYDTEATQFTEDTENTDEIYHMEDEDYILVFKKPDVAGAVL